MSMDAPPPPPPPPPPDHNEKTPMEKWEAAEDRMMAENIVANRQEAEILRQQGNFEAAQQIEDSIAKLPVSDDIKLDPEGYLDSQQHGSDQTPASADARTDTPGSRPAGDAPLTPMEKWEAAEDRMMAENIVANRQEAEILRQQGNSEAAQQIEDSIAKLPVSDDIKAHPQAYLDAFGHDRPPDGPDAGSNGGNNGKPPPERFEPGTAGSAGSPGDLPPASPADNDTREERTGRAFTVRTPWPRPEGESQPSPVEFTDLGPAADLLPPEQRAAETHPIPMGYLHEDPGVDARASVPEALDPAEAARNDQGHQNYPGVDVDWHNRDPLPEGMYVVQTIRVENGEPQPGRSPYFTSLETLKQSGPDAYEYNTQAQVGAGPRDHYEYRDVAVYRLTRPIEGVAEGTTSQNTQFGPGGSDQYYTRGPGGDHALNPHDNPGYFELVPYSEVKELLGFDNVDIPDDLKYIPMSHKSSPVDLTGLATWSRKT